LPKTAAELSKATKEKEVGWQH